MPLTTAQQIRLRIQDRIRLGEDIIRGDGTASGFKLLQGSPFSTLQSGASAYVATNAGWSATGASIDLTLGRVVLSGLPSANTALRVEYQWSVFSDDEIDYFLAAGGSLPGASLRAVESLLFDSLKRARWAAPDNTQYDDQQAQNTLLKMRDIFKEELNEDNPAAGGIESWGENQPDFYGPYSA